MRKLLARLIESALGISALDRIYRANPLDPSEHPFALAIRLLDLRRTLTPGSYERIPSSGAVIVVANHPTGGRDSVLLMDLLLLKRPDVRVVSHPWFGRYPSFIPYTVMMDPRDKSPVGKELNRKGYDAALGLLKEGGALLYFPAGSVAYPQRGTGKYRDPEWRYGIDRLIRESGVPVLPITLDGRLSRWYRALARLAPKWRTLLLAKELLWMRSTSQQARVHPLMTVSELDQRAGTERHSRFLQRLVEGPLDGSR